MATFSNTQLQLTISQINLLENYVELPFSVEYTEHLLKYNGGKCVPNVFNFTENGRITDSCVDWFLAISDGEHNDLKTHINWYKIDEKRLPTHILPIAHDPCGNLVCISCSGKDIGCVYFWDHEKEVDYSMAGDDYYSNLYLIANSFNEFIKGLKENFA
jgi:hypothetical protein